MDSPSAPLLPVSDGVKPLRHTLGDMICNPPINEEVDDIVPERPASARSAGHVQTQPSAGLPPAGIAVRSSGAAFPCATLSTAGAAAARRGSSRDAPS